MTMAKLACLVSGSGFVMSVLCLLIPEFGERTVNKEDVDNVVSAYNQVSSMIEHKE